LDATAEESRVNADGEVVMIGVAANRRITVVRASNGIIVTVHPGTPRRRS
jgi:hypothetical protein